MGEDSPDQRDGAPTKAEADHEHILGVGEHHAVKQHMHALPAQTRQGRPHNRPIHAFGGEPFVIQKPPKALNFARLLRQQGHGGGHGPLLGRDRLTHPGQHAGKRGTQVGAQLRQGGGQAGGYGIIPG